MVQAEYRARVPEQLAQLSVELVHSRAPLLAERLPATAIDWLTTLTAATLPEGQPYPALFDTLEAVLSAVESRSEEHTSELQSLMRISYAVFCLKNKKNTLATNHGNQIRPP